MLLSGSWSLQLVTDNSSDYEEDNCTAGLCSDNHQLVCSKCSTPL